MDQTVPPSHVISVCPILGRHWLCLVGVRALYELLRRRINSFRVTAVILIFSCLWFLTLMIMSITPARTFAHHQDTRILCNRTAVVVYVPGCTAVFAFIPSLRDGTSSLSRCATSPKYTPLFAEQGKGAHFCLGISRLCVGRLKRRWRHYDGRCLSPCARRAGRPASTGGRHQAHETSLRHV